MFYSGFEYEVKVVVFSCKVYLFIGKLCWQIMGGGGGKESPSSDTPPDVTLGVAGPKDLRHPSAAPALVALPLVLCFSSCC